MPQVPLPKVALNPIKPAISNVEVSPETYGGGLARPLGQAAEIAGEIAAKEKERRVSDEVTQGSSVAQTGQNTALEEAQSVDYKLGATKDGWTKPYLEKNQKLWQEAASRATTPEAAQRMREQGIRAQATFESALNAHVIRERNEERKFNNKLLIQAETDAAKMQPTDARRLDLSESNINNMVAENAKGLKPEQIAQLQKQATSAFYADVIGSIPDENATQAFALFEAAKKQGKLNKDDEKKVGDSLEAHKTRVVGTVKGDQIWAESGRDFDAAMARANDPDEISDPTIKLAVETRIRQLDSDHTQRLKQQDQQDIDAAWAAYVEGKPVDRNTYTRLLQRNPQTIVAIQNEQVRDKNVKIATNYEAWSDFMGLSDEELARPENAARTRLQGKVSDSLMTRAIVYQEAAKDRLQKKATPKQLAEIQIRSWITGEATRAKLGTDAAGKFGEYAEHRVAEFITLNERNPTDKELKAITDDALIKGAVDTWGPFNPTRRKFQLKPGEAFMEPTPTPARTPPDAVGAVPPEAAGKIAAQFRKAGVPNPTPEQILAQYKKLTQKSAPAPPVNYGQDDGTRP